jgi:hypothetical protein
VHLVFGQRQFIGMSLERLLYLGTGFGVRAGRFRIRKFGCMCVVYDNGGAGDVVTDERIDPRPVGVMLCSEVGQRFLEVIVGISISLLEHGDQCIEIGHIGLSDFKKADRQQRYQKYC